MIKKKPRAKNHYAGTVKYDPTFMISYQEYCDVMYKPPSKKYNRRLCWWVPGIVAVNNSPPRKGKQYKLF